MKWPLFENKIKEKLTDHRTEVEVDALWAAIEPEVDAINRARRKKRYGFLWLMLAGTLLLGSGVLIYYFSNSNLSTPTTTIDQIEKSHTNVLTDEDANNKKEINADQPSTTNNDALNNQTTAEKTEENINLKSENKNPKTAPLPTYFNQKKKINKTENNTLKIAPVNPENQPAGDFIENNFIENNFIEKKRTPYLPQRLTAAPLSPIKIKSVPVVFLQNNSPAGQNHFPIIKKNGPATLPSEKNLPNAHSDMMPGNESDSTNIENTTIAETRLNTTTDPTPEPAPLEDRRHPMEKKGFSFALGANTGLSFANRRLTATDSIGNTLKDLRENTEKQLETAHLGIQFNARHKSGFDFQTGLQFTRMTERFAYRENITTVDSIDGILYYAVNPNNDTAAIMGVVPHTTITDINKKYYNRYTMLDIPLLVGYFTENNNWNFGAQAGAFINISLQTEGRVLKNETQDEDIKNLFNSSVGVSYYLGISANYKITGNLEIGLSPFVRHFPENFAKSNYPLSQKYTLYGVNAGLKYWF